jgi:hypothetical protein
VIVGYEVKPLAKSDGLIGEYDFSEEKLRDSVGSSPQNWLLKAQP